MLAVRRGSGRSSLPYEWLICRMVEYCIDGSRWCCYSLPGSSMQAFCNADEATLHHLTRKELKMKKNKSKATSMTSVILAVYLALSPNIHIDFSRSSLVQSDGAAISNIQIGLTKAKSGEIAQ